MLRFVCYAIDMIVGRLENKIGQQNLVIPIILRWS